MLQLWKHQILAVTRYQARKFLGLLFSCGTGKTATIIRIAEKKGLPVIYITPDILCNQVQQTLNDPEIVTEEWETLVCTNRERKLVRFKKAFIKFIGKETCN